MGTAVAVDELDALIEEAARRGFLWQWFRVDHHGREACAGVLEWRTCADVAVLFDTGSHAYRTRVGPGVDVFVPSRTHWWYPRSTEVDAVWVLRAVLTLPRPNEPGGLPPLVPAPYGLGVPGYRVAVRTWT